MSFSKCKLLVSKINNDKCLHGRFVKHENKNKNSRIACEICMVTSKSRGHCLLLHLIYVEEFKFKHLLRDDLCSTNYCFKNVRQDSNRDTVII